MKYRVKKYQRKKKCPFEPYEPKKRVEISREEALPIMIRIGHMFVFLGGLAGFWASSALIGLKGVLGFKKKVDRLSLNNKVVELRVKKY